MRIIKVSATESTNNMARDWYSSHKDSGAVVFVANEQTAGKGQRGANWLSNAGENLTMSILYPQPSIEISNPFLLSAGVGLAVLKTLDKLKINRLKLKWPNDIMAANKKIGGILIENVLSNGSIAASVIGLGLNVNQTHFPGLPQAASLRSLSGGQYDLDDVLQNVAESISKFMEELKSTAGEVILQEYEEVLFRRNQISTFELPDGHLLTGKIEGITSTGLLKVQVEDYVIKTFDLKELKLLF